MIPIRIKIKQTPHEGQKAFLKSEARFRAVACGRRFGKTTGAIMDMLLHLQKNLRHFWWVAPTYQQAKIAFRMLERALPPKLTKVNKSELRIEFLNLAVFEFKSAERPDNLRGFGLEYLVIDEAAFIDEVVWEDVLRPALADKHGKLLAIGTPKGKNWFYQLWLRGQDPNFPDYASWQMPTWVNPWIPRSEIDELRRTLPERVFQQEIEAMFLEDAGGVFRNVEQVVQPYKVPIQPSGQVVIGVDLAKYEDFTVLIAMDELGRVVDFDRFNKLDWEIQKNRIRAMADRYKAKVIIDSTGVGDPIYEDLRKLGLRVEGYKFTLESKERLINNLAVRIENREITIPNIPELIKELKIFQYELTKSGRVHLSAPAGFHDDCVVALALAAWATSKPSKFATAKPFL